jgi:hypothetical protein
MPSERHVSALATGALSLRDEDGYRSWSDDGPIPLYAWWQVLSLGGLHDSLCGRSPLVMLAGGPKQLRQELDRRAAYLSDRDYLGRLVAGDQDLELLLARTQSVFLPAVRRRYYAGVVIGADGDIFSDDAYAWAIAERRSLDYERAAEECGVNAQDIAERFDELMMRAERLDPLKEWRDLTDQVDRRHTEALRGEALRAQDYYDACGVLRRWYYRLEGTDLRAVRDASSGFGRSRQEVNEQLYGVENLGGNRAALPGILDRFGLYPWKVMLITEGEGDVAMLEVIVSHYTGATFERLGIVPHVLGTPQHPRKRDQRVQELLAALRRFPNYFLFVFDNEGTAAVWAEVLERYTTDHAPFKGITVLEEEPQSAEGAPSVEGWSGGSYWPKRRPEAEIWKQDIEHDNFTAAEICQVLSEMASRDERISNFQLTADELLRAHGASRKGIAEVALALSEDRTFRVSKVDLDRELGRYAVAHPELDGAWRRVLIVAEHLYRLTVAHRRMRGRLRERERIALLEDEQRN